MSGITILGEGAWGTAIATVLAYNGHRVKLWCYSHQHAEAISTTGYNTRYLPEIKLSPLIIPTADLAEALIGASWIFEAIPVQYLRSILDRCVPYYCPTVPWVVLSKGIENGTYLVPTQIIEQVFTTAAPPCIVLSGPSFARDVARGQTTGVIIASHSIEYAQCLQQLIENSYFRTFMHADVQGVQLAGAVKNVIALGMGILEGAGYSESTRAFFLMRALEEMQLLLAVFGGPCATVYSLAGLGDLMLTATSKQSRNTIVGKLLGTGMPLAQVLEQTGAIPEGVNTLVSLIQYASQHGLTIPLYKSIYNFIFNQAQSTVIIEQLSV